MREEIMSELENISEETIDKMYSSIILNSSQFTSKEIRQIRFYMGFDTGFSLQMQENIAIQEFNKLNNGKRKEV